MCSDRNKRKKPTKPQIIFSVYVFTHFLAFHEKLIDFDLAAILNLVKRNEKKRQKLFSEHVNFN
jgi:hypothetical protein